MANDLPRPSRFITDHNAEGKAIFNTEVSEELEETLLGDSHKFFLGYATTQTPVKLEKNEDIETYKSFIADPPGLMIPGGTVLRIVDFKPATVSPMHRTVSLDYGVVLKGDIELVLDSGESRVMKAGDIAIQRGTMHQWINRSKTEWARMLFVLQESKPVPVDGKALEEDLGDEMTGVMPSRA